MSFYPPGLSYSAFGEAMCSERPDPPYELECPECGCKPEPDCDYCKGKVLTTDTLTEDQWAEWKREHMHYINPRTGEWYRTMFQYSEDW